MGTGGGYHGVHPSSCTCGRCFLAKKEELRARLAKRDAAWAASKGAAAPSPRAAAAPSPRADADPGGATDAFVTVGETLTQLETAADVARLSLMIENTRTARSHLLNERSSRSHCLAHLHLTERDGAQVRRRQLLLVDLAGSERVLKSGSTAFN